MRRTTLPLCQAVNKAFVDSRLHPLYKLQFVLLVFIHVEENFVGIDAVIFVATLSVLWDRRDLSQGLLCENVMFSIKPEVNNILQFHSYLNSEPRPQEHVGTEYLVKFCYVVFEICLQRRTDTDRSMLFTILCTFPEGGIRTNNVCSALILCC